MSFISIPCCSAARRKLPAKKIPADLQIRKNLFEHSAKYLAIIYIGSSLATFQSPKANTQSNLNYTVEVNLKGCWGLKIPHSLRIRCLLHFNSQPRQNQGSVIGLSSQRDREAVVPGQHKEAILKPHQDTDTTKKLPTCTPKTLKYIKLKGSCEAMSKSCLLKSLIDVVFLLERHQARNVPYPLWSRSSNAPRPKWPKLASSTTVEDAASIPYPKWKAWQ